MHMNSLYIGSLSNVAFPVACFTCIVTSVIRENLNAINEALHWALPFIWAGKTLILWKVFIFKLKAYFFGKGTQWELIDEKKKNLFQRCRENTKKSARHYLFVCLFRVFHPTREFFTHLETSPLPVKGCKFWPMLGTHCHWAVGVL